MKRTIVMSVAMIVAALALTQPYLAGAAGTPASKATAQVGGINILADTDQDWTSVLDATIKTPNGKDLFVDVSLECGLFTRTKAVSQGGVLDTSTSESSVKVVVVLDAGTPAERVAAPGETTFCRRTQTLSGKYAGIENCEDKNGDGEVTDDECELTPEETELLLDTMNANSFNYVIGNLKSGVHTISVLAKIDLETTTQNGEAEARAAIGKGSVTVETVRIARTAVIELA